MSSASVSGRYYLSGNDWTLCTLNHLSRQATGCGHNSQVILCLDHPLDLARINPLLGSFTALFPLLQGRCARAWNLAPYWSDRRTGTGRIPFSARDEVSDAEALAHLQKEVNRPFENEYDHVRFLQVTVAEHAYVSLVFDHRLFDARGAQMFLHRFHQYVNGQCDLTGPYRPVRDPGLTHWQEKFRAGRRVNRRFLDLATGGAVRALPVPPKLTGVPFEFRTLTFDRTRSDLITENAYATAGYLMLAPYLLAAGLAAFSAVFDRELGAGEHLMIPVNTDIRSRAPGWSELFFNHLSFLFLRLPAREAGWSLTWIKLVSTLMYEAMSGGFAQDVAQANSLLRIVPRRYLARVQDLLRHGRRQTLSFSYVNKGYESRDFCGARVTKILHTPRVPIDPGIGLYFSQYNGCYSFTLAYLKTMLSAPQADALKATLEDLLVRLPE